MPVIPISLDGQSQFIANLALGAMSGLPGVGLPFSVAVAATGEKGAGLHDYDPMWEAALGSSAVVAAGLAYFAPQTARQLTQYTMWSAMQGAGFYPTMGGAAAGEIGVSGIGWSAPAWALQAAFIWGGYHGLVKPMGRGILEGRKPRQGKSYRDADGSGTSDKQKRMEKFERGY